MSNRALPPLGRGLVDRAVQRIGQDIVGERFAADAGLPNEAEWCEELGVSRSVLREALRVLTSKNLIAIRARVGGRVRPRAEWNLLDPDILGWCAHGKDQDRFVAELYELRRTIEPVAAGLAAMRICEAELASLRAALHDMEHAGEDVDRFIEPDGRFHRTILGAVGNSLFQALAQTVMVALDMTIRMSLDAPKGQRQSVPLHRVVLEAIARRDSAAAATAMLCLVDSSERDVAEARLLRAGTNSKRASRSGRRLSTGRR